MSETASTARDVLDAVIEAIGGSAREGQQRMVAEIDETITNRTRLMVQAGTGTGKSIGYLVPLLVSCATTGRRALVSTATLALQRQILTKDAPIVQEAVGGITGVRPTVAVLKGWSNYLCPHRVNGGYPSEGTLFEGFGADASSGPSSDLGAQILRLREFASDTDTGDRDDLVPGVSDRAWRQVSVSKRECLGKNCPMIDECFAQRAREAANEADLVVTNHSLFGIHATGESDLFPEIDAIVIDEAHELSDRVRTQSTHSLSQSGIARVVRTLRTHAKVVADDLDTAGAELGAALEPQSVGLMMTRPQTVRDAMRLVDDAVRRAATGVQDCQADAAAKALARGALDELKDAMSAWSGGEAETITWVTRPDDSTAATLSMCPLDVAPALGIKGFADHPVVLTSATLSLGGSFDAMARDCGFMMGQGPWRAIDVGSPFDPARQGIVYVAEHLEDPGLQWPNEGALDELVGLAKASDGGMLALFSSWRGAQVGAEALRERTDLEILVQGDETLSALVDRFRANRDACLVGTLSLWQGVDVAGSSCRLVVMDRIPFPHPSDPVAKARAIDAERRGMSGFQTVSLTHAALLMAQGAGRLLRSGEDRGVVAILDRRVVSKSYGSFIRSSMPAMWPTTDARVVRQALARLATRP